MMMMMMTKRYCAITKHKIDLFPSSAGNVHQLASGGRQGERRQSGYFGYFYIPGFSGSWHALRVAWSTGGHIVFIIRVPVQQQSIQSEQC